jgi:SET domain-containing protein
MMTAAASKSTEIVAETDLVIFRESRIHGCGGFARQAIAKGRRVIEYVGERIDKRESLRRCEDNNEYIFTLDDAHDLDGKVPWNPARLINHGCAPNCDAEVDEGRVWIVANRDIQPGEELTFNYNFGLEDYQEYPCRCGAPECVGFMVAEEFFDHVRKRYS